jgi:hypothetical protein
MSQIPAIRPLSIASYSGDAGAGAGVADAERNAVESLLFAYSYNWDSRDANATASLFTEDADVAFFLNGAVEATHQTVGRARLVETMTARTEMLKRWRVETRHLMTNTVFGPTEGGEVQAMSTAVIFWQQLPDHPAPQAVQTGYYRSWCVETEAGWQFRRRETHMSGVFHPKQLFEMPT